MTLIAGIQPALANPVPESSIPDNVDWFAHIDADQFRATRVGGAFFNQLTQLDPLKNNEKFPINPILVLNGLKGITAFGTMPDPKAMETGDVDVVTLVTGTPELIQIFKGLISGFQLEKPEAIQQLKEGDYTILTMTDAGVSGVFVGNDQIALSKSMESMSRFLAVKSGRKSHLEFGRQFPVPTEIQNLGVYLGAYVEGIGEYKQLPAQARILQMTKAVAVQLGESNDNVHLLTSLITDRPETATQVRDVLNGLIAVMLLTQNGNPDIETLSRSATVSQIGSAVTLKVDYPAGSAEKWIGVLVEKIKSEMEKEQSPAGADAEVTEDADTIEPIREKEPVG